MAVDGRSVSRIATAPVRGFALDARDEVELSAAGVVENRRFMLVDAEGNRLRSSLTAWPVVVRGRYDPASERLWMRFPDRTEVEETALAHGERVDPKVGERSVPSRIVEGPWEEPLSRLAGKPVRVARPDEPGIAQEAPVGRSTVGASECS